MSHHSALKSIVLGCVFSAGVFAGGYLLALAPTTSVATVSHEVLRDKCFEGSDSDASRIASGCDEVIRLGQIDDRGLASAHLRRGQAFIGLGKR